MSASPPTALTNVLQRFSQELDAPAAAPEALRSVGNGVKLYGFEEPAEPMSEPAPEDIVALLAEQPEVAPLADVEEMAATARKPAHRSMREHQPKPGRQRGSKEQRFVSLPPEPPQSRAEVLIAELRSRVGPVALRPARSFRQVPKPARPAAAPPDEPAPRRPIEAPPLPASAPAPAMDRYGRQPASRNRRLYRRVRLGAEIEVDGTPCTLIDISIGGFAATGIANLGANSIVPVALRLTIDGIEVGTRLNARIIYAHSERSSGRFIDVTASQTAFLRYIVTWRGESVGTVGTTTLLDAISGGPDHGFPAKSANGTKERWWAGLIGWRANPPH